MMAVFTVIASDIDGNVSTFLLKAKDAAAAETLMRKQTDDDMIAVATLPGCHALNCDQHSDEPEEWTAVGFFELEPWRLVVEACSAEEAVKLAWAQIEAEHGLDELGNLPLEICGAIWGSFPQPTPLPWHPGPRIRLSALAG